MSIGIIIVKKIIIKEKNTLREGSLGLLLEKSLLIREIIALGLLLEISLHWAY